MKINSKQKGAAGERELANILKQYGYKTRRGQQYSGASGDADVIGLDYIHIECKRVERLNLTSAYEQAKRDAKQGIYPAVFHRKNREKWMVSMSLDHWLDLYDAFLKSFKEVENGTGNN